MRQIGAVIIRFQASIRGRFCKKCFMSKFWEFTLITFFLGWWGIISLCVTPFVLINNIVMLCRSFSVGPRPADAALPRLQEEHARLLKPVQESATRRLEAGEDAVALARDIAQQTGVTPGQAYLFLGALAASMPPPIPSGAV